MLKSEHLLDPTAAGQSSVPDFYVRPAAPDEIHSGLNQAGLLSRPGFLPHMCRIGVLDGHVISTIVTGRGVLVYGKRQLRAGVLTHLYLLPAFRDQGYDTLMIQDTLTYLHEQGAHLALVRDPSGAYARFGFSPLWPDYFMTFNAAQAASLDSPHAIHTPERAHIPQMAALYHRHWGTRVAFQRKPELWLWRMTEDQTRQILVTTEESGRVSGYISGFSLLDDEIEVVTDNIEAASTLMAKAGQLALEAGRETVRWLVPPEDPLVYFARALLDVVMSAYFHQNSGWLGRIIDTNALVKAVLPELITQAQSTLGEFDPNSLTMKANPAHMDIQLSGPYPITITLTYRDFGQMLFGSLTPQAFAYRERLKPGGLELLQAMFPPRVAALGHWDWA